MEIVKYHVNITDTLERELERAIRLANSLREAAALEELYYGPSIRESIAFAKLIREGMPVRQAAEVVYANVYEQWGEVEYRKVIDMITSIFG
jgi:nitric oxide reductase NorQ protein